jgi:hypothetical protein
MADEYEKVMNGIGFERFASGFMVGGTIMLCVCVLSMSDCDEMSYKRGRRHAAEDLERYGVVQLAPPPTTETDSQSTN